MSSVEELLLDAVLPILKIASVCHPFASSQLAPRNMSSRRQVQVRLGRQGIVDAVIIIMWCLVLGKKGVSILLLEGV